MLLKKTCRLTPPAKVSITERQPIQAVGDQGTRFTYPLTALTAGQGLRPTTYKASKDLYRLSLPSQHV